MATQVAKKVINKIKKSQGYDKHVMIDESPKEITVAFGHSKHKHNELIHHNFGTKKNSSMKVDGSLSFDEFVDSVKAPPVEAASKDVPVGPGPDASSENKED